MTGFYANIEEKTIHNTNFRQVLYTGKFMQLVVMSLKKGEEIGMEVHDAVDQFFRIEEGSAKFIIDGQENTVLADDVVVVPAGSQHNIINVGDGDLKLYTIYAPPNHPDGTVHQTKEEAMKAEEEEHH